MRFRNFLVLPAVICVALGLASTAARAETLADALVYAYENSGLLAQNRSLLQIADEDVAQAVSRLMPIISWSASASRNFPTPAMAESDVSLNAQLSAELTLYDFGRNALAIESQKELVLATRQSLLAVEQQVLGRVVEAYLNLRRANEFVQLRQNNVRLITEEQRAAQDRFDVGEVTRTDVALAQARLAAARSLLAAEEGARIRAVEEFRAAVGRAPGALNPAPSAPVTRGLAEAKTIALSQHPNLREAQINVNVAELNIRRAEAETRPTIGLRGSADIQRDRDPLGSQSLGLTIGGPIYSGGALASTLRQAQLRRDASRANLLITAQLIEQNVGNAYSFLEAARASQQASQLQVEAATVAFDGIREEAQLGARTTLDVLNAEQELLDANANLISAQADETIATYSVLSSMGLLTAQNLGLPVQIYDPAAYYNLVRTSPPALSSQGRALDRVLRSIGQE